MSAEAGARARRGVWGGRAGVAVARTAQPAALGAVIGDPVVWLLVLVGLALRLLVGVWLPEHQFVSDEAEYYAAARILADGRGFSYYEAAPWLRPPGYLLLLAAIFRLAGESPEVVRWVQVGLSLGLAPLAAWLGWLVAGERTVARLAAGVTMLLLPLAIFPWLLLTETLFTLLLLLGIAAALERLHGGDRRWLLLAGTALTGACLVRGLAAGFVGLVLLILWLWGGRPRRERLVDVALTAAVVAALLLPWTVRNAVAYRAFIPLETTGAYNLWLRAQGGRGESWMLSELREEPDPARRQTHALTRGLELVKADPAAYLVRGGSELLDVWRLNFGAPERFMRGYAGGEVERPWLLLSLVLDDLLYLLLLPLAALGLARRGGTGRWLTLAWLGWTGLAALLFFAIARFRVPMLPLLAVYGAVGAVGLAHTRVAAGRLRAARNLLVLAIVVAPLAVALSTFDYRSYLVGWAARPRWELATAAEQARRAGDPETALALLDGEPVEIPAARLTRALALAALGRHEAAEAEVASLRVDERALVVRGELRRLRGDEAGARRLWDSREIDESDAVDWAWSRVGQPSRRVEVGDGLDLGLVRGLYADEREGAVRYRWTNGDSAIRLALPRPGAATIALRVRTERPAAAGVPVRVYAGDVPVGSLTVTNTWSTQIVNVQSDRTEVVLRLYSSTWVPGYADARHLGIMIDWVEVAPYQGAG